MDFLNLIEIDTIPSKEKIERKINKRKLKEEKILLKKEKRKKRKNYKKEKNKNNRNNFFLNMTEEEYEIYQINRKLKEKNINYRLNDNLKNGYQIIIDNYYTNILSIKEINSLSCQLGLCYNLIRNKENCNISLNICSYYDDLKKHLENNGSTNWIVNFIDIDFEKHFNLNNENFVYLSPDAEEEIQEFDPNIKYIIGGIVDKTVKKDLTKNRAKELNIKSMKLPLDKFKKNNNHFRNSLNLTTMIEIFHYYFETKDILKSIEMSIPKRYLKNLN